MGVRRPGYSGCLEVDLASAGGVVQEEDGLGDRRGLDPGDDAYGEEVPVRRRREILRLIIKEKTNRDIAEELFISEFTVETHRKNIFRKTGAGSLVGLVNFAHANGLMELE